MRALWLEDRGLRLREDLDAPTPPPGEALIRVTRAGICSTDHGLIAGLYPFAGVLGHEFVGVVESGSPAWRGKRVVGEINAVCGRCARCRRGFGKHCAERTVFGIVGRNGAFAEYTTLPEENLHAVPDEVSDAQAVFTEPLAAALDIQEQIRVGPDDRVLLVGDGKLGQLIAQTLALTGCDLVVVGRHERKLDLLRARGIATVNASGVEPGAFDIAVECTGNEHGFHVARSALRPQGTLVLKSTYPGELKVDATMLAVDEIRLVGSRCGSFAPALRLLKDRRVDVLPLDEASFPLSEGLAAIERSRERGTLKITLDTSV